jgi:hypothetical protein
MAQGLATFDDKLCCQDCLTQWDQWDWAKCESRMRWLHVGNNSSFVQATVCGCVIYRDVNGSYVVSRQDRPLKKVRVATLAGAYAACQGWDKFHAHQG